MVLLTFNSVYNVVKPLLDADIDECSGSDHGCEQICMNTFGSFVCNCTVGYNLNANGQDCDGTNWVYYVPIYIISLFSDIDECLLSTSDCEITCENTLGSYECSCGEGYVLNTDGRTCTGVKLISE